MDKKKIRLGIAPIGWTNDDMPDLGGGVTFAQCVSEMALAGFKGCEIGNKYPSKISVLKKELRLRKLRIANCWFSTFILTKPYEEVEREFARKLKFLKAMGAKVIGCSEQSHSIQGCLDKAVFDDKYVLSDAEWKRLGEGYNRLGAAARDMGMSLTFHHHMGTVVQTEREIDRFMAETDPSSVFLLFDSGHLAYCGEDYISVLKKYIGRVRHIHLKDIRPEIIAAVRAGKKSFLEGVRMGTFTVPGDGAVDFPAIFGIVDGAGYEGWMLVEAEQDPARANPLEYALKARKYIKKTAKI